MNCQRLRHLLVDRARGLAEDARGGAELDRHLDACPSCREQLGREAALTRGLRALASSAGPGDGAVELEERLLAAFARHQRSSRGTAWSAAPSRALAAAAAVVLLAAAGGIYVARQAATAPSSRTPASSQAGRAPLDGFIPLPAAAGLPAFESGQIVRIHVPVASLPAYGVEIIPDAPAAAVQADVLVGQDGLPRAIRLVDADES